MSLYDGIKDVAKIVQQADNIELYRQLLDLGAQALDLQAENARLRNELLEMKKEKEIESRIERHQQPYLTLIDDAPHLKYCATCWDRDRKLIQMREVTEHMSTGSWTKLSCNNCHSKCQPD